MNANGANLFSDEQLSQLVELTSGAYWEVDSEHRFVKYLSERPLRSGDVLGKQPWELSLSLVGTDWAEHRRVLARRAPFDDLLLREVREDGGERFYRIGGRPRFAADGEFLGYFGIARDTTCDLRSERLMQLEQRIAALLSSDGSSAEITKAALQAICESQGWESGWYWRADDEQGVLRRDVGWYEPGERLTAVMLEAEGLTMPLGRGLPGVAWQTRQPLWIPDLIRETRVMHRDVIERTGWRHALLVPVVMSDRVVGVLDFNGRRMSEPDDRLLKIIQVLGMHLGSYYERAVTAERLRESEALFSSTVELAAIGIGHVARDGRFVHANRRLCEMLGYTRDEMVGLGFRDISHPDDIHLTDHDRKKLHAGEIDSFTAEKRYLRKDGAAIWVKVTIVVKRDRAGSALYDISIVEDISERKHAEERVQYLATHDEMTALPNRTMFLELLSHATDSTRRRGGQCAVLFIDLDRFKVINDSLGHQAGDELLVQVATRLSQRLRSSDVLARLGGDEFVVMLDDVKGESEVAEVARRVLSSVLEPVEIMGQDCRVTASVGAALYPRDADNAAMLMKHADIAMYHAKEEGKNNFQFFSREICPMSTERLTIESRLRTALENGEFTLQYQPKVDLRTGDICGTEALLRWWNSDLGSVAPVQFIPLAEETGLIVPIGKWVLKTACAQNVEWQRRGLPKILMAVNLSPRQFRDPRLLQDVAEALDETGMAPELLELEITEGMLMTNVDQAVERVAAIKELGVRLAIDDFGTGYSSLSQLKRFPIDTLKVDRSFIRSVPSDREDRAITEAIISMGKTLGVTVVAEGVENMSQQTFLSSRQCDEMQGFLFSKPRHPDAFADLFRETLDKKARAS